MQIYLFLYVSGVTYGYHIMEPLVCDFVEFIH